MRSEVGLLKTLVRELMTSELPPRVPEQALVMTEPGSVAAYTDAGRSGGALSGAYVYHVAQMCEVLRPGDTVLDLGCGPAHLLGQLAALNPTVHFVGVELSPEMLREGEALIQARRLRNVEFDLSDMSRLSHWRDGSVQAVVSSMSLHHLPDLTALERLFLNIQRVLAPGGGVYLWDFGRLRRTESIQYFVRRATGGTESFLSRDYEQSLRAAFSRQEMRDVARRYLGRAVRVYSTAFSPLVLVVKSAPRRRMSVFQPELRQMLHDLPDARRRDVRQLQLFLRLSGLRSTL